jgi:hypothetical protein
MSAKAKANLNTSEPNALMLFTSEIQRKEEYIDGLRSQLLTEIPREKEHIKTRLIECKSNIHSKEASKKYQQVALKNMEKTRTLLGSTRSDHPVEPNIKLIVALGLVTGVFLGIFMAFIREFWANNRDRILNKE